MSKKKNIFIIMCVVLCCITLFGAFSSIFFKPNSNNNSSCDVDYSTMKIACLGDSITFGMCQGVAMENPYPKLVSKELGLNGYYNLGFGGSSIVSTKANSFVERVSSIPKGTDIISVLGGVNDWALNKPLGTIDDTTTTTIYGALNFLAQYLTTNHRDAFVFFMTVLPVSDAKLEEYAETDYTLQDVAKAQKEVAEKFGIAVLDTYSLSGFEDVCNDTAKTDGVHPNQDFHTNNLTPLIANFIKENYNK